MNIYLCEYNVTPNVEKKDKLLVEVEDSKITYNDNSIANAKLVSEINELILSYKDTLLKAKNVQHSNSKGGRQKRLNILSENICDEKILLIGNTDNEEISKFYDEFKNKLISLLENYFI